MNDVPLTSSMHITRLRVAQLRQFRAPFELRDFTSGLNIFSGPNEAGKSTLVRAIRAAFFERHRSTVVDDLRPWGDSAAAPEIELDFEFAGQVCRLNKSFLAKKRCTLQVDSNIGSTCFEGVEAEDHLAQIFGFAFAGKGASKSEHWGIPGLLWVEQGTGQDVQLAAQHAREHVHDALQQGQAAGSASMRAAAGALAATRGDVVLERLRSQRAELLTAAGKPRAAYSAAIEQVELLSAQLAVLDTQITLYRQQVDQLASLRAQHQAEDVAKPWHVWRIQLEERQRQQQALQGSEQNLVEARRRHAQLVQQHSLLLHQLSTLAQQEDDGRQRAQRLFKLGEEIDAAEVRVVDTRLRLNTAQAQASAARHAVQQAHQHSTRHALHTQVQDAQVQAERSQQDLARAETEQVRLIQLTGQATACAITPKALKELQNLESRRRELSLQQQSLATRLAFELVPGVRLSVQGAEAVLLRDVGERWLLAPTTLDIPGVGRLHISPGGADLDERVRELACTEDALQRALQRAGLPDVSAAEARMAQHKDIQAQMRLADQAVNLMAPQGLDALRQAAAQAAARLQTSQAALSALDTSPAAQHPAHVEGGSTPLPLDEAEARQISAQAELDAARQAHTQALQQQATAQSRREDAQREWATSRALLEQPGRPQELAQAQQALLVTQAERDAVAVRIEFEQAQLLQARPDIVAQDIERLGRSIEHAQRSQQQRREQILVLENTLQQAGAQGLEEARATLAGECARAERRQTELQRRAAALDLLCQKLEGQRSATLARLQAPLQQHLQHYLPLLFPQATLHITEDLVPGGLSRQGRAGTLETGDFSALSFGAREQLGLISRFAYADLLRSAGRPTLLILDDALVHSDELRLEAMKRVLFDVATRHQVLLFTCHPELWQDMGVAMRHLDTTIFKWR
jgi:hypothetical protein